MKFSKSELDIIYQYAALTKVETLVGMKEIVPVIKDLLTKAIVENASVSTALTRLPERKAQRAGGRNQDKKPCRRCCQETLS